MVWTEETVHEAVENQRAYFRTNATLEVSWRIEQLKKLKAAMIKWTPEIEKALNLDLGRSEAEGYFCDIGDVIMEINDCPIK